MIETYKILTRKYDIETAPSLVGVCSSVTRGHSLRLQKRICCRLTSGHITRIHGQSYRPIVTHLTSWPSFAVHCSPS